MDCRLHVVWAMAARLKKKDYKVYVVMGDGEQGEGSVWESASYATAKGLDNIVGILDRNGLQIMGQIRRCVTPHPWKKGTVHSDGM